ncbi:hypothetical protein [Micromonospora sp. NPDC005220]|uniref:hypothetical protein n=1 Tax=Micromonospora sp. NPDC005220 TaxID=3155589 RepID=UPI0033B89D8C
MERETFDLVATTVHRQIPRTVRAQRTTLALLREAVSHQPDNMHDLLDEVFRLSTDDQDNLKTLLDRTSLATVIKTSTSVSEAAGETEPFQSRFRQHGAHELTMVTAVIGWDCLGSVDSRRRVVQRKRWPMTRPPEL